MRSICRLLISASLLFLSFAGHSQAQQATLLVPGQTLEPTISGRQTHTYRLTLQTGQFVHFDVEQTSCDVALTLTAPDGKKREVNLTPFGLPEILSEEIATAGEYQFTLRSLDFPKMSGAYRLQVAVKATADATDQKRIEAERLLLELRGNLPAPQRLEKAQHLLTLWHELGERFWEANANVVIGSAYSQQQNWAKAIEHVEIALAITRELKLQVGEALNLNSLGNFYRSQGQREKGLEYSQQALAIAREIKAMPLAANILTSLGNTYFGQSLFDQALGFYEQANVLRAEVGDPAGEIDFLNVKGMIASRQRKYDEAQKLYETALDKAREQENKFFEAFVLRNLGQLSTSQGQTEKAQSYFQLALQITVERADRSEEYQLRRAIATGFIASGHYKEALPHLEIALSIAREMKNPGMEADTLDALGFVSYFGKNDMPQAIAYHEQALATYRQLKIRQAELFQLTRLGFMYSEDAQDDLSRTYYESALAIVRELKDSREAMVLNQLGQLYHRIYGTDKAIETYEQMLTASRSFKQKNWEADALTNLGTAYIYGKQNIEKGSQYLEQSLVVSKEANYHVGHSFNLQQLSQVNRMLGEYEKAVDLMKESIVVATKVGPGAKQ
ncbi:MAG TPA: tetratricopeptide repeat protein, partial [Blastocatellia bacterium]|nr:tetratricopeptide repeat protein [Blastocatellia bacterium]